MPQDAGLPQTGDSQEIGQDAYDCLRANRPKGWQLTELGGVNDYGFDFQVQISVQQQVIHPFRLQLKGTRSPERSIDGSYLSIDLSCSTLRLFDNTDEPVLLVLCDLSIEPGDPSKGMLYYVWVREELERIQVDKIPLGQKEAAIRVPTNNFLDRSTDLVSEVRKRHRLSRVGHALETGVEEMDPSLGSEERVVMVEAITRNIAARDLVFAQALADPTIEIWVNPPRDSLAWLLTESRSAATSGNVGKCEGLLQRVSANLPKCTLLERAEYWHLTGRARLVRGDEEGAATAFRTAAETQPRAKYWAAWAESEMRRRFKRDRNEDYADVIDALPTGADPALLSVKARLLAAGGRYVDAMTLIDSFDGAESLAARAVVETMQSRPVEALQACLDGLSLRENPDSTTLLFLILRARARFNIAMKEVQVDHREQDDFEDEVIPPSGPIGVDAMALRAAWDDIAEAVSAIEEIRWLSNAEFVIDIWIATASMLGKQGAILQRVLAAARSRPEQGQLQSAAETIAAQCGDFQAALEANGRSPDDDTKILRRVFFLHELGKHRDCVDVMTRHQTSIRRTHQLFGPALVLAALSADVIARVDLVESWSAILSTGDSEWGAHKATLDYLLARRKNQLQAAEALVALFQADELLGHPKPTTLLLFQELDPGSKDQAQRFLSVSNRMRAHMRLSPLAAIKIGAALATLENWAQLLKLCDEASAEFDVPARIKAFRALALDRLGRSDEARAVLESLLEAGVEDGLALNTYVNIMVRCGFTEKARSVAERLLEQATTVQRRSECVRMLFNLEQHANPNSPRLADLAFRMGELAAADDEEEEGVFLCMVIAATSFSQATLSPSRIDQFHARANAFFDRFPTSKVLRRIELHREGGAEKMLRSMKAAIGLSEEQEQQRAQLEAQLQSGALTLPFAWRPRFALRNVQDVAHLWELSKRSTPEDKRLHLNMIGQSQAERSADSLQSRTPLFDLLTLFLLKDLDLLNAAFSFFQKVAISQETLSDLVRLSQGFAGSIVRDKCTELQERLKPHIANILQPRGLLSDEDRYMPRSSQELRALAASGDYVFYSDDAMLRMWLLEEKVHLDGMCTMDLLWALEERGLLTTGEVAIRLARLCDWHVGIQIQLRHQLALVPPEVHASHRVADGVLLLRNNAAFMSIARGMWGPHTEFLAGIAHIGSVVRALVQDPAVSTVTIGAFAASWIEHVTSRPDMPVPALRLASQISLNAVALGKMPIAATRRLWTVYFGLVECLNGFIDRGTIEAATLLVAREAGLLDKRIAHQREKSFAQLGEALMLGLDPNSNDWVAFSVAYIKGRK